MDDDDPRDREVRSRPGGDWDAVIRALYDRDAAWDAWRDDVTHTVSVEFPTMGFHLEVFEDEVSWTTGPVGLSSAHRRALLRLGTHVESAVRLRRLPSSLVAVVTASGSVEGRTDVRGLWRGLVRGELGVVERRERGDARFWFIENDPRHLRLRALTDGEERVVTMICEGQQANEVSFALGITPAAVSVRLRRATEKLALASRFDLLRVAAILLRDRGARVGATALSPAESDVLGLLARGLSNGEIAAARSRSVRTVAKQVASVLKKLGANGRRALAGFALAAAPRTSDPETGKGRWRLP